MMAAEGEDQGFVTYPTETAREDMTRIRDDHNQPHMPETVRNVEVRRNDLGIDVPRF